MSSVKDALNGAKAVAIGMSTTFREMWQKPVTIQYPEEKRPVNQIAVWLNQALLINARDESSSRTEGGVSLELWTAATGYRMFVDDITVRSLMTDDVYEGVQGEVLSIAAPGVLANDTDPYGQGASAFLLKSPAQGSLDLAGNGSFSYVPHPGFVGQDTFIYETRSGTNRVGTGWGILNVLDSGGTGNAPRITTILRNDNTVTLSWTAIAGRSYRLQYKLDIQDTAWVDVTPDMLAELAADPKFVAVKESSADARDRSPPSQSRYRSPSGRGSIAPRRRTERLVTTATPVRRPTPARPAYALEPTRSHAQPRISAMTRESAIRPPASAAARPGSMARPATTAMPAPRPTPARRRAAPGRARWSAPPRISSMSRGSAIRRPAPAPARPRPTGRPATTAMPAPRPTPARRGRAPGRARRSAPPRVH